MIHLDPPADLTDLYDFGHAGTVEAPSVADRLRSLAAKVGTWEALADQLGYSTNHLHAVVGGRKSITRKLLFRIERLEQGRPATLAA